jgi:hypothetical protein
MYGLESLKAINATADAQAEDKARQARGLKPKTPLAHSLRKARSTAGVRASR